MDIVKLNLYAEAYYSGAVYEEDIVISKNLYEKIKEELNKYDYKNENGSGICITELDGKYSEDDGRLYIEEYSEDEVPNCNWDIKEDGEELYYTIKDICNEKSLDLDTNIKTVKEYLNSIDSYVEVSVRARKSNVEKIKEYANSLEQK